MKRYQRIIGSPILSNCFAITGLVITAFLAFFTGNSIGAIVILGLTSIFLFVFIILARKFYKESEMIDVINLLSIIQEKCIKMPQYPTNLEHGQNSKEKDLEKDGKGFILTNSLDYDIFYCAEIVDNILKGATYIYYLPKNSSVLNELHDFIEALDLHLSKKNLTRDAADSCYKQLFFNVIPTDVTCIYNFARFYQPGDGVPNSNFEQSWWYVHATKGSEKDPKAPMLSKMIIDASDQERLQRVFHILRKTCCSHNGLDIYNNRRQLVEYLGDVIK